MCRLWMESSVQISMCRLWMESSVQISKGPDKIILTSYIVIRHLPNLPGCTFAVLRGSP